MDEGVREDARVVLVRRPGGAQVGVDGVAAQRRGEVSLPARRNEARVLCGRGAPTLGRVSRRVIGRRFGARASAPQSCTQAAPPTQLLASGSAPLPAAHVIELEEPLDTIGVGLLHELRHHLAGRAPEAVEDGVAQPHLPRARGHGQGEHPGQRQGRGGLRGGRAAPARSGRARGSGPRTPAPRRARRRSGRPCRRPGRKSSSRRGTRVPKRRRAAHGANSRRRPVPPTSGGARGGGEVMCGQARSGEVGGARGSSP